MTKSTRGGRGRFCTQPCENAAASVTCNELQPTVHHAVQEGGVGRVEYSNFPAILPLYARPAVCLYFGSV